MVARIVSAARMFGMPLLDHGRHAIDHSASVNFSSVLFVIVSP
jgi:hypothetical protein